MSPKPVDVRNALATLRNEAPTSEQTSRLLDTLHRPSPRRNVRPLVLTMTATAFALLVFMPHPGSGSAWAQTLDATLGAPNSHMVLRQPGSNAEFEEWRSGNRRSYRRFGKDGHVGSELRSDGIHRLHVYRLKGLSPSNSRTYAVLDKPVKTPSQYDLPLNNLTALLRQPNLAIVSHEVARGTKPEFYRLRVSRPLPEEYVAEVDPKVRRIRRLISVRDGSERVFDYPESIPDRVFDPTPPPGIEVYDVAKQNALIKRRQETGLGKSGPVTLRLVLLDGDGRLWASWTGGLKHLEPMGTSGPIRLIGIPSSKPQGTRIVYSNWRRLPNDAHGNVRFQGEPVAQTMVVPRGKIGKTVGLEIPYPGGVARFSKVPVLRIGLSHNYDLTFGDRAALGKRD